MTNNKPSEGFGDTISKIINKITKRKKEECEPCRKRKEKLNRLIPYKKKKDG